MVVLVEVEKAAFAGRFEVLDSEVGIKKVSLEADVLFKFLRALFKTRPFGDCTVFAFGSGWT